MKTQNLRLNVQPRANYVCKVQFAWQASEKKKQQTKTKTSPKQYLQVREHGEASLEMAWEIPVELWYAFRQPPFILTSSRFLIKK